MKKFKWTNELRKEAKEQLLIIANHYEVKQRKNLKGVVYDSDGTARWEGEAHNYSVYMPTFLKTKKY